MTSNMRYPRTSLLVICGILILFKFNRCTEIGNSKRQEQKIDTTANYGKFQDSSGSLELNNIVKEYLESYKDTVKIDTSLTYEDKRIQISFRHYCLFDSAVNIPEKYIRTYRLHQFVTHNFQSSLKIIADGELTIDTVIRKNLFEKKLHQELKDYGILTAPNFSIADDHVLVDYSISIPLTDVGTGCSLLCDFKGKLMTKID